MKGKAQDWQKGPRHQILRAAVRGVQNAPRSVDVALPVARLHVAAAEAAARIVAAKAARPRPRKFCEHLRHRRPRRRLRDRLARKRRTLAAKEWKHETTTITTAVATTTTRRWRALRSKSPRQSPRFRSQRQRAPSRRRAPRPQRLPRHPLPAEQGRVGGGLFGIPSEAPTGLLSRDAKPAGTAASS